MKNILAALLMLSWATKIFSQDDTQKITDSILAEGKRLYRSEMASWHGTDIFLEKFQSKRDRIGGYFSYEDGQLTTCLFFSKDEIPEVLGTISFDSTYRALNAIIKTESRGLTEAEKKIYTVRQMVLKEITNDEFFKSYENSHFNIIPVIDADESRVYALTGPSVSGVVILGNDYLLRYDKDNKLTEKKRLHKNIIPVNYGEKTEKKVVGTMHSHLPETGDFITATDICTLMLYGKFTDWKQHIVISANYISIWDFEKNQLVTLTKEAWENMNKPADESNKKKNKRKN